MNTETGPAPLRVLLWSPTGSGEHYNGPASFTYRLYSSAPKGRIDLTLAHGSPQQEDYALFQQQHCIGNSSAAGLAHAKFVMDGQRWVKEHHKQFDIMHAIGGFQNSVGPAYCAEKLGLPTALFISNHLTQLGQSGSWRKLLGLHKQRQRKVRELSALIAMSQDINDELLGYGVEEHRIARIPMGVNVDVFQPLQTAGEKSRLREKLGWPDRPTLIFVGTVVNRKQPHVLVEAIGKLKQQNVDCQLVIAGPESEPEYAANIRGSIDSLGISESVIWAGFTRDVAPLYQAADLFCLPSLNEGMAAALIEAMGSGVVPLVTPISGSADVVVSGENGQYIKAEANDIAGAVATYLNDSALMSSHAENAVKLVREYYSNEAVYNAYEQLFRRLNQGGTAAV